MFRDAHRTIVRSRWLFISEFVISGRFLDTERRLKMLTNFATVLNLIFGVFTNTAGGLKRFKSITSFSIVFNLFFEKFSETFTDAKRFTNMTVLATVFSLNLGILSLVIALAKSCLHPSNLVSLVFRLG